MTTNGTGAKARSHSARTFLRMVMSPDDVMCTYISDKKKITGHLSIVKPSFPQIVHSIGTALSDFYVMNS